MWPVSATAVKSTQSTFCRSFRLTTIPMHKALSPLKGQFADFLERIIRHKDTFCPASAYEIAFYKRTHLDIQPSRILFPRKSPSFTSMNVFSHLFECFLHFSCTDTSSAHLDQSDACADSAVGARNERLHASIACCSKNLLDWRWVRVFK